MLRALAFRSSTNLIVRCRPFCEFVNFNSRRMSGASDRCRRAALVSNAVTLRGNVPVRNFSQNEGEKDSSFPSRSTLAAIAAVACGIGAYIRIRNYEENGQIAGKAVVGQSVGRPNLGGSFTLIDHNKKIVRDTDFKGKWMFMYFGFTYCPDICPNELLRMVEVINTLDKQGVKLEPIFITIDPARDGPEQLKSYLSDWHPRLVGLTGKQEQIDEVCKKFRVYYSKSQLGPDPSDYLIDHSVMFYLVDPDGKFTDYFAKNLTPAQMAQRIAAYDAEFRKARA